MQASLRLSFVIIAVAVGSDRAQAEIPELLQPHPCIHLSSIDVASGIYGETVHGGEVSGESAATPGLCQRFARAPQERPDVLVLAAVLMSL